MIRPAPEAGRGPRRGVGRGADARRISSRRSGRRSASRPSLPPRGPTPSASERAWADSADARRTSSRRDGRRSASGPSLPPRSHAQRIRTGVGGQRERPEDLFARRWTSLRMAPLGCPPVPRQAHPRRRPVVFAFPSRMKPAAVPLDDPNERCARSTREVRERGRVRWSHSSPRTNDVPRSARRCGGVAGRGGPTRRPERSARSARRCGSVAGCGGPSRRSERTKRPVRPEMQGRGRAQRRGLRIAAGVSGPAPSSGTTPPG